jgi:hypothetical protein
MQRLCAAAESEFNVYPFRSEEYLRLFLPELQDGVGSQRILLIGASDAREMLLFERFDAAFAGEKAFQGSLSGCVFDDFLLTLEYLERVYGADSLPKVLVLGISARVVANIPAGAPADELDGMASPLASAINRHSPYFGVSHSSEGPRLVAKTWLQGLQSRLHFCAKQPSRYRTALVAQMVKSVPDCYSSHSLVRKASAWLKPYMCHQHAPLPAEDVQQWIAQPTSFWYRTHQWEPGADTIAVRLRIRRLLDYVQRQGIELYVVNLPEQIWARQGYQPGRYETYLQLVEDSFGETPFLNLRDYLAVDEFQDSSHATYSGAVRVTDRVIKFIQAERNRRVSRRDDVREAVR